jgi:3-methylfumaryl-CoA hydratase
MFAAAELAFQAPIDLDQPAELSLTVADVRHRSGKSGDLVFVEVDRQLTQDGAPRLAERQTIVFRGAGEPQTPIVPREVAPPPQAEPWNPGPVDLFRFSAVTFNSHRIHYDLPYATGEEGYPGLVVHGPFTAAKLFGYARARADRRIRRFAFRAAAPLFAGQPILLAPGAGLGEVQAIRCDGAVAMTAAVDA